MPITKLTSLRAEPLSVPLVDPFVIATGRVDATRSVLVTCELERDGARATGLGEAACLRPVTKEDQPDALVAIERAPLVGLEIAAWDALRAPLDAALGETPVARAGVEMALLDALARLEGVPLYALLGGKRPAAEIVTDITLPILPPERMAELATQWWSQGFTAFKVKVGKDFEHDCRGLAAVGRATPRATLRIDANCGFTAAQALAFLDEAARLGLRVECFEQPCGTQDLAALAEVAAKTEVPVVADESIKTMDDLAKVQRAHAADGVNLKIAKSGGLLAALEIGRRAQEAGLALMVGGMVETRLGMTAAAHLVAALGGVAWPDLDTAWLLRTDPFEGGYEARGPRYRLPEAAGLGITRRG